MSDHLIHPITRERLKFDTVNRAYRSLYAVYKSGFDRKVAEDVFGTMSDDIWPFVKRKYYEQGQKYETIKIRRRLESAKGRKKWWGRVRDTDDGSITPKAVIKLLRNQDFKCALCQVYLNSAAHKQLDHIKPVSKGGPHILSNVQWLCRTCNISKNNKYEDGH